MLTDPLYKPVTDRPSIKRKSRPTKSRAVPKKQILKMIEISSPVDKLANDTIAQSHEKYTTAQIKFAIMSNCEYAPGSEITEEIIAGAHIKTNNTQAFWPTIF
jgi:hypothetical protein